MASLAACDNSLGKEIFLPYPPPPFDCDLVQGERRGIEVDEDWLPDVEDIFSGKYATLIDLTGDSESESAIEPCSYLPCEPATVLPALSYTQPQPTTLNRTPPPAHQPTKVVNSLSLGQIEIPESPGAVQTSSAASVQSHHHGDGDDDDSTASATGPMIAPTAAASSSIGTDSVLEKPYKQEQPTGDQELRETNGDGGLSVSRLLDAPMSTSAIQLQEPGTILELETPGAVPDHHPGSQSASRPVLPTREVCPGGGACVNIQNITFLHVEGQRETADGPEYLCVGKVWLRPSGGVLSDHIQDYRRKVARTARLATLRTRKRTSEAVDFANATRCPARKRVKRAQV